MNGDNVNRIEALERRIDALEKMFEVTDNHDSNTVEIDLTLPEDDIDGLHFNAQGVHAVFEKKEDGWYHSRDILFLSARNTEDDNNRDILTEYLTKHDSCHSIKSQIALAMAAKRVTDIEISLPGENEGIKKYNGVDCWYWLSDKYSGSAAYFCGVSSYGGTDNSVASAVGGCVPAFRVKEDENA